jgi:hypothetical protein
MAKEEGYGVTGFPTRAGNGIIKASARFKPPKVPKPSKVVNPLATVAKVKAPKAPKVTIL